MSIQDLRVKKTTLAAKAKNLIEENDGDKWTEEINTVYEGVMSDLKKVNAEIQRFQDLLDEAGGALDGDYQTPGQVAAMAATHGIEVMHKPVYKNLGEQMLDVRAMTIDSAEAPKARERFQKIVNASGANTGVDSEGGYLVETDKASEIMKTAVETGVLSSRVTRQPIGPNADGFSYLAFKDRDRSAGTMLGGIQVYRKAEAQLMVSSGKALLEERELRLEDMYGLIYVTNRMLRDAVAMAAYAKQGLRDQLAWKLDYEIWQGNGSGRCLGVTQADIMISVTRTTTSTITTPDISNMWSRFIGKNPVWFINRDCNPQLDILSITAGTGALEPRFVTYDAQGIMRIKGAPVVPIEFCSTMGTLYDIVLADFSEYLLIEKGGVEEAESMHVRFLYDEMCYRFITRNNGQPKDETAITPLNGSNTLSPFVALAS